MNEKYIGPGGRWMIFAGVPMLFTALLLLPKGLPFEHTLGTTAAAWIQFGFIMVIFVLAMALYKNVFRTRATQLGIAGWCVTFAMTLWYFWFGPGALGHH